jgi:plastocyanin
MNPPLVGDKDPGGGFYVLHLRYLNRPAFVVLALLALAAIAAACTGDDEEEGAPAASPSATATPAAFPSDGVEAITVDVVQRDSFFEPDTLTVRAGQTVTIRVENRGNLTHNLHVAGADNVFDAGGDDVVSDPSAMTGGETGELTVTFDEPGTFQFRCDFHPTIMTGEIVVQ